MISKISIATEALWLHHHRSLANYFTQGNFVLCSSVLTKVFSGEELAWDLDNGDVVYFHPPTYLLLEPLSRGHGIESSHVFSLFIPFLSPVRFCNSWPLPRVIILRHNSMKTN